MDVELASRAAQARASTPSPTGGGGDGFSGIEGLTEDLKEIKTDLKAALKGLSYLRCKADGAPSTLQLIGFATAVFVAAGITPGFTR